MGVAQEVVLAVAMGGLDDKPWVNLGRKGHTTSCPVPTTATDRSLPRRSPPMWQPRPRLDNRRSRAYPPEAYMGADQVGRRP